MFHFLVSVSVLCAGQVVVWERVIQVMKGNGDSSDEGKRVRHVLEGVRIREMRDGSLIPINHCRAWGVPRLVGETYFFEIKTMGAWVTQER